MNEEYIGVRHIGGPNLMWTAKLNRKNVIGYFSSPVDAARAYDAVAFARYGADAKLNFPEEFGLSREICEPPDGYFD